jgi:hypothetical protein
VEEELGPVVGLERDHVRSVDHAYDMTADPGP